MRWYCVTMLHVDWECMVRLLELWLDGRGLAGGLGGLLNG